MTVVVVAFMDEVTRSQHGDTSFVPYTPTSINFSGVNHPAEAAQSLVDYNYQMSFFLWFSLQQQVTRGRSFQFCMERRVAHGLMMLSEPPSLSSQISGFLAYVLSSILRNSPSTTANKTRPEN